VDLDKVSTFIILHRCSTVWSQKYAFIHKKLQKQMILEQRLCLRVRHGSASMSPTWPWLAHPQQRSNAGAHTTKLDRLGVALHLRCPHHCSELIHPPMRWWCSRINGGVFALLSHFACLLAFLHCHFKFTHCTTDMLQMREYQILSLGQISRLVLAPIGQFKSFANHVSVHQSQLVTKNKARSLSKNSIFSKKNIIYALQSTYPHRHTTHLNATDATHFHRTQNTPSTVGRSKYILKMYTREAMNESTMSNNLHTKTPPSRHIPIIPIAVDSTTLGCSHRGSH